jgi:hypothetical protein
MERSPHCETSVWTACDTATFATLATMGRCPPFVVGVARTVFVANVANVASPTLKKRGARPRLATARFSITDGQNTVGHVVEVCGRYEGPHGGQQAGRKLRDAGGLMTARPPADVRPEVGS